MLIVLIGTFVEVNKTLIRRSPKIDTTEKGDEKVIEAHETKQEESKFMWTEFS